jgi:GMP synthase (glutamine-hydrolysing)
LKRIAIIDCAIHSPSLPCFLKMKKTFNQSLSMHAPAHFGMNSITKDNPDGWIIFGSHSNVSDQLPWHLELALFIQDQLKQKIPTLGICFGHQLMADQFGATISKVKGKNSSYQGKRTTTIINERFGLKKESQFDIFTSHKYEVSKLSDQLIHIGQSNECHYDMIAHKTLPYLGLQGHPESSEYFIQSELDTPMCKKYLEDVLVGGDDFMETTLKHLFGISSFLKY